MTARGGTDGAGPFARPSLLGGLGLVALLVAGVAAARSGHGPVTGPVPSPPDEVAPTAALPTLAVSAPPDARPTDLPGWVLVVVLTVVGLAGLVLLVLLVRVLLRLVRRRAGGRDPGAVAAPPVAAGDDVGALLRERVDAAGSLLPEPGGPPGDAVVACWVALERAAAGTGVPRDPAQTSTEFTAELVGRHLDPAAEPALARLRARYQRARFSSRPVGEDEAAAARAELRAVADALGGRVRDRDTPDGNGDGDTPGARVAEGNASSTRAGRL